MSTQKMLSHRKRKIQQLTYNYYLFGIFVKNKHIQEGKMLSIRSIAVILLLITHSADADDLSTPSIVLTFDDLPCQGSGKFKRQLEINQKILTTLKKYHTCAIAFANAGRFARKKDAIDLLKLWINEGHILGNHTYNHSAASKVSLKSYKQDIANGEKIIKAALQEENCGDNLAYFRFPYLDSGGKKKKQALLQYLQEKNYDPPVGVTIDSKDYKYNKKNSAQADKDFVEYVKHQLENNRDNFRKHIILFHVNRITADNLDKIIQLMINNGYKLKEHQQDNHCPFICKN